ncbi:MAG: thioredoxin TrxC [Nitrospiraceae bacterium]|nr:thioredoxin TrxC [Nitrospiraceae bacterium]
MTASLHVTCPHCRMVNRVPTARLADRPSCGQCHAPLFEGHPISLSRQDFELHHTRSDIPLLVDFWAPWCGPCRMMAPAYEQAAKRLEPQVRLGKVNTEEERGLAGRFGIVSIPTMILFRSGREVARQSGALGADDIVRWVRASL